MPEAEKKTAAKKSPRQTKTKPRRRGEEADGGAKKPRRGEKAGYAEKEAREEGLTPRQAAKKAQPEEAAAKPKKPGSARVGKEKPYPVALEANRRQRAAARRAPGGRPVHGKGSRPSRRKAAAAGKRRRRPGARSGR